MNERLEGKPVAAAGATDEDWQLLSDQLAAAVGEDGWPVGQARAVLLAAVGGEPSDEAVVWRHGAAD